MVCFSGLRVPDDVPSSSEGLDADGGDGNTGRVHAKGNFPPGVRTSAEGPGVGMVCSEMDLVPTKGRLAGVGRERSV